MVHKANISESERSHIRNLLPSVYPAIGPFIFLDHIGPNTLPAGQQISVPAHPHAGIETISYLFSGTGLHRDSLGIRQPLEAGRLNWMTAGSGVVHAEGSGQPEPYPSLVHGVQLWTYLPEAQQHEAPYFQTFARTELPVIPLAGQSFVRVLAGEYAGQTAPTRLVRPLLLVHLHLTDGVSFTLPVPAGFEAGAYLTSGSALINEEQVDTSGLVVANDRLAFTGLTDADMMILAGEPLTEQRFAYGPFVMTDRRAVQQAIERYQRGEMGDVPAETKLKLS